jgi:hypothetical protein
MAAIATLTVRLNAQIAEFQSEFRQATKDAQKFADGFEGVATRAAAVGTFFGNIATDIAKSLAAGLANALRDAVKFSSEFNNAFIGLGSVARAFGTDTDSATAAARRLSAVSGLVQSRTVHPVDERVQGLGGVWPSGRVVIWRCDPICDGRRQERQFDPGRQRWCHEEPVADFERGRI